MTATDLDPLFVKALKLLNSKSKDSAAQLKAMLDEVIAQRKGLKVPIQSGDAGKLSPSRSSRDDDCKRKESEKRPFEKGSKDVSEPELKKSKFDSKHRSKDEKDAREKERDKEKARREREKKEKEEKEAQRQREKAEKEKKAKMQSSSKLETEVTMVSDDEEEASSQLDAGNFALEMDITCVVCKQFRVSSGNQLVECQECHSLYHQECHKPPVAEETVNDPRNVWYCSRCQKMLQKKQQQAAQKPAGKAPKTTAPSTSLLGKEAHALAPLAQPFKPDTTSSTLGGISSSSTTSQAFRKIDPKLIVPPKETNSQSKPILGLAGLAANLTKPQSKSSSAHRKLEQKGDGLVKSSKTDGSKSSSKSDSTSSSSKSKGEEKRYDKTSSSSSDKDRKSEAGASKSSSGNNINSKEDKKSSSGESSSKSYSSSSSSASAQSSSSFLEKGEKKYSSESSSKSEKKFTSSDSSRSSSSSSGLKLDVTASSLGSKSSPSQASTPETPDSPSVGSLSKMGIGGSSGGSGSGSGTGSSVDKNKKAVANLSMITANKRIQMMMKKAQAKPSEKKLHIK